jgi:DnaJ homolog subfamily C member 9
VTTEDIETFEKEYKNSKEELKDLKEAYLNFKGDMEEIMENIMLSDESDFERFENIFKEMIKNKEIPKYKAFSKKVSKETRLEVAKQESIEAELSLKELKEKINERKLIRRDDFESMTNHLASKYNEENDENIFQPEPTEEEFQKARSRLTPSPSPKKRKRNEETPSRDAKKKK